MKFEKGQKIQVPVKAKHIAHGKAHSAFCCPIALALNDLFGGGTDPALDAPWSAVGPRYATMRFPDATALVFNSTPGVSEFIDRFDNGQQVNPTTVEFEVSEELIYNGPEVNFFNQCLDMVKNAMDKAVEHATE